MRRSVAAALGVLALAACADDEPSAAETRADQLRQVAEEAGLGDDVADVLADAARGDGTYRVVYEVDGRRVTVTQRGDDRRVDTEAEDGTVDVALSVDGTTHACTKPPEGEWRCEELGSTPPAGVFDDDAVDALADDLATADEIGVEDQEVAGTAARCITSSPPPARLCVAETGAILLVERPAGTLRATEHTAEVADDAFALPA